METDDALRDRLIARRLLSGAQVPAEKVCVRCGIPFQETVIPCPDRLPGPGVGLTCLVLHYGLRCPTCGGAIYEGTACD